MKALLYVTAFSLIGFAAQADDDFCQQYPDAPVCLQASSPDKTFCQEFPNNAACSASAPTVAPTTVVDSDSQPTNVQTEPSAPVIAQPEPQAPVESSQPAPQQRTNIVIVTDQAGAASAQAIRNTILSTAPFSCMNLKIEIREVSKEQLNCEPRMTQPRLLACNSETHRVANRIRREINDNVQASPQQPQRRRHWWQRIFNGGNRGATRDAEIALVVVDYNEWAGAGWEHTPLVSTRLDPRGAIHEMLHGMGYHDEYIEGAVNSGGTIMRNINGGIPQNWWPHIADYMNVTMPTSCGQ